MSTSTYIKHICQISSSVRILGRPAISLQCVKTRQLSSQARATVSDEIDNDGAVNFRVSPWQVCASVCLIRLPLIEPEKSELEKCYETLMDQIEHEKSIMNQWEMEKIRQLDVIAGVESGERSMDDIDFKLTNQDIEDSCDQVLTNFKENAIEIGAEDSDFNDVNRRPKESLVFVTKQKLGNDVVWMLPMKAWDKGETLRETAENALFTCLGDEVSATFISNAPSAFYKYKMPKLARNDNGSLYTGTKLFIWSAVLPRSSSSHSSAPPFSVSQEGRDASGVMNYAWVARDEMRAFLKPKYMNIIQDIML